MSDAVAHGGDGSALAHAKLQLSTLSRLQRRIGDASAGNLSALRGEVMATVAATQALAQQANVAGTQTYSTAQVALQRASEGARVSVTSFMHGYYDRHEFDRYLTFASDEDKDEYRKREQDRKKAIDAAMAEHTPEGNLRANRLSIEQLKDAGAHGADQSSKFKPLLEGLEADGSKLSMQIDATKSTAPVRTQARTTVAEDKALADAVTPDVLATLRATKVAISDERQDGHGITARATDAAAARSPS